MGEHTESENGGFKQKTAVDRFIRRRQIQFIFMFEYAQRPRDWPMRSQSKQSNDQYRLEDMRLTQG